MWNRVEIPAKDLSEIVDFYQNGISITSLSKTFGYGIKSIERTLLELGVRKIQPRQFHVLTSKKSEIYGKYLSGLSMSALAKEYGVTEMVISHFFKKHKFVTRPNGCNVNGREIGIASDYSSGMGLHEVAAKYKICAGKTLKRILSDKGVKVRTISEANRRFAVNECFLDEIDSEEKAYFLGFFFADGYNNQKKGHVIIELQKRDESVLFQFQRLFDSECPVREEKPGYSKFILHSKYLSNRLAELGCPQAKSRFVTFPDWMAENLLPHFIRGYNDGDGCIYVKGKQCNISIIGSDAFVSGLAQVIQNMTVVNVKVRQHPTSDGMSLLNIYGRQQTKRVVGFLYTNASIYLERKKVKANRIFHNL